MEVIVELPEAPHITVSTRKLTHIAYMGRFTDAELVGIYTAAKTVVEIEVWLDKFRMANDVDLDDPRTADGLQALEDATLLAPGRAAEILA